MTRCHNMYEIMIYAKPLLSVVANDNKTKKDFASAYQDLKQ